jgi:hypothetical protein
MEKSFTGRETSPKEIVEDAIGRALMGAMIYSFTYARKKKIDGF